MVRSELWGGQSRTDHVPLCLFLPRNACLVLCLESSSCWKMKRLQIRHFPGGTPKSDSSCPDSQFHQFWQDAQQHWLKYSPKPWQTLHPVLQTAVNTQYLLCLVQIFHIWVHHSIRTVAPDCHISSWVIWHNSAFSLPRGWFVDRHTFTGTSCDEASANSRWSRSISQVLCQVFNGFFFLKDLTLRYCWGRFFRPSTSFCHPHVQFPLGLQLLISTTVCFTQQKSTAKLQIWQQNMSC